MEWEANVARTYPGHNEPVANGSIRGVNRGRAAPSVYSLPAWAPISTCLFSSLTKTTRGSKPRFRSASSYSP